MAKFWGEIGYSETEETRPGVWKEILTKRNYCGEVIRNMSRRSAAPDSTNDNLTLSTQISIVADMFAYQNFHSMKYVEFMGAKWKIESVEPQYPRLILTLGGVYNGK